MNVMTHKGFAARIEFDAEDEIFVGHIAGLADVVGFHARTVSELKAAFHDAVDNYVETCRRLGREPHKSYSGKMMFRVDPDIHARAAKAAELAGKSLNQWAEEVLSKASETAE